jgi:hypothetical protein
MAARIDPSSLPTPRGPWPVVHGLSQLHDAGRWWCVNSAGHPGEDDYPDAELHVPWRECQGPSVALKGLRRDLDGQALDVNTYVAAPYRFGEPRTQRGDTSTRVVIDAADERAEDPALRMSLSLGEAVRFARILNRLVDEISYPRTREA